MSRIWWKKRSLIWLLVALTAVWGTVASAHIHLDDGHSHGEVCHLPHSGAAQQTAIPFSFPPVIAAPQTTQVVHCDSATLLAYHSRAPPA